MPAYSTVASLASSPSVFTGPATLFGDDSPETWKRDVRPNENEESEQSRFAPHFIDVHALPRRLPRLTKEAIACFRRKLRFIPTETTRYASILGFLNKYTRSTFCCAHLQDSLGLYQTGVVWPLPSAAKVAQMHEVGPSFVSLMMNSDLAQSIAAAKAGKAITFPDSLFRSSLLFRFACRKLDEYYMGLYAYPKRDDGSRMVVFITRDQKGRAYGAKELATMERICTAFEPELSLRDPLRVFMPRQPTPAEHKFRMDADFRPDNPSLYARSLLALYYGKSSSEADDSPLLPEALVQELKTYRDHFLRFGEPTQEGGSQAFSKNHLGRVLLISLQTLPGGSFELTLHEDLRQHLRLYSIMDACRNLPRDRPAIYTACLVIAEGIAESDEIVRRAGASALAPASAKRIVKAAQKIVAQAH